MLKTERLVGLLLGLNQAPEKRYENNSFDIGHVVESITALEFGRTTEQQICEWET